MTPRKPAFDVDLRYGAQGENILHDEMGLGRCEVKTDRRWRTTANVFIELEAWRDTHGCYLPSGIRDPECEADSVALVLHLEARVAIFLPREYLLRVAKSFERHGRQYDLQREGSHPTRGYAISVGYLLHPTTLAQYMPAEFAMSTQESEGTP